MNLGCIVLIMVTLIDSSIAQEEGQIVALFLRGRIGLSLQLGSVHFSLHCL